MGKPMNTWEIENVSEVLPPEEIRHTHFLYSDWPIITWPRAQLPHSYKITNLLETLLSILSIYSRQTGYSAHWNTC
jgi:hypothetical protein